MDSINTASPAWVFSLLPAALWSGALTPILAEDTLKGMTLISTFDTSDLSSLWKGNASTSTSGSGTLGQWLTKDGLFSFDPSAVRSLILNSASDASATNLTGFLHQKLDKTGFSYANRSYGGGSSVGLVDLASSKPANWISYSEPGFVSQVSCIYNASTAFRLKELEEPFAWTLSIRQVEGSYQNGATTGGWIYVGYSPDDIFSWEAVYSNESRKSYVSVATGATATQDSWSFNAFNNIQCDINFKATTNHVLVNYTSKIIAVTPENDINPWPHYADAVMDKVTNWLWVFSYVDTSFGGSYLGRSLRLNVNQLQNATGESGTATTLRGVSDYLTSCVDSVLVSLASARIVASNATVSTEALVGVPAAMLGDKKYTYGILVLNMVICLIYCGEALRTRFWRDTPPLDIMDLANVVVAAWRGGVAYGRPYQDGSDDYCSSSASEIFESDRPVNELSFALVGRRNNTFSIAPIVECQDRVLSALRAYS